LSLRRLGECRDSEREDQENSESCFHRREKIADICCDRYHLLNLGGAVLWKSALRFSAFLCDSAVKLLYFIFTAESQRNAEIRGVEIRAPT
jgi:hypothetical protein